MSFRLDAGKDFLNFPIHADEEGGARNAHDFFPVHILLFEHIVVDGGFLVDVAQQRKGQMVFGFEPRLRCRRVG